MIEIVNILRARALVIFLSRLSITCPLILAEEYICLYFVVKLKSKVKQLKVVY